MRRADSRPDLAARLDGFFRLAIVLAAITALVGGLRIASSLLYFEPAMQRAVAASHAVAVAHEGMLDQELGLRSYLHSRSESSLAPYRDGVEATSAGLLTAARLFGGDDAAQEAVQLAHRRGAEWSNGYAAPALAGAMAGQDTTGLLEQGSATLAEYRAASRRLTAASDAHIEQLLLTQTRFVTSLSAVQLGFCVFLLLMARRQRRRTVTEVVEPVDELLHALDRLRGGELEVQLRGAGPRELRELAGGVSELAVSLAADRDERERRERRAERQAASANQLLAHSRSFSGALQVTHVLGELGRALSALQPGSALRLWMPGADDDVPVVVLAERWSGEPAETGLVPGSAVCEAFRYGRRVERSQDGTRLLALPLFGNGRTLGVLELLVDSDFDDESTGVLETLLVHAGTALHAAELHEKSAVAGERDALTGLYNRGRLDVDLAREASLAGRTLAPLALIMVDVDHFKKYNDSFGHQAGDEVLQQVAAALRSSVRETDSVYRYGGEEFAVIMRGTDLPGAGLLGERVRERVAEQLAAWRVTVSLGVAELPASAGTPSALLRAADEALYRAKRAGRNVVVLAGDGEPSEAGRRGPAES